MVLGTGIFWLLIATALVVAMIFVQYRRYRADMLLTMVASAMQRRLPLGPVLETFGADTEGWGPLRGRKLAQWIDQGVPLDVALARAGQSLGDSAAVLLRMGGHVDDLSGALTTLTQESRLYREQGRNIIARLCYLIMIITPAIPILVFYMWSLAPSLTKIFREFNMELPLITRLMMGSFSFLIGASVLLAPLLLLIWIYTAVRFVTDIRIDLPLLRRMNMPYHSAIILQALAIPAQRQQPLSPALEMLAQSYPRRFIRRRLARAATLVERGHDWIDSLRAGRLLRKADVAVLRAAQRVGNLPWAMRELAAAGTRRLVFRMQTASNIIFPLLLLAFGLVIAFLSLGMFLPLITLISRLAR